MNAPNIDHKNSEAKRQSKAALLARILNMVRGKQSRLWRWACRIMYACIILGILLSWSSMLWFERHIPHRFTTWLLLRLYGFVWLNAFISLHVQLVGLIGKRGVLPAANTMEILETNLNRLMEEQNLLDAENQKTQTDVLSRATRLYRKYIPQTAQRFLQIPTLCWVFGSSDRSVLWQSRLGITCAILQILDILPNIALMGVCYLCYMSLKVLTRDFLALQWDALILEAGALVILLCPFQLRLPLYSALRQWPPLPILWLLRLLIFKLMFSSGWVKIASGDISWKVHVMYMYVH